MINTILSDFSRVILIPKDKNYQGTLNGLYKELLGKNEPFNFFDYFEFNEDILSLYSSLKNQYSINIFTKGTIQNTKEVIKRINPIFDNIFSATELGIDKKQPAAYLFIAKKLNKLPSEIIYIDDSLNNINAAQQAGLATIHYEDFAKFKKQIKFLLS